jgi:hypothetical protein
VGIDPFKWIKSLYLFVYTFKSNETRKVENHFVYILFFKIKKMILSNVTFCAWG